MRSMWSGSLSFGLVNIPVRLYTATQDHEISFDMLHKKDFSPIRYAKICKTEDKEVEYKDIVKGYEYEKGHYVVLTDEDFASVNQKKSRTIEITSFTYEQEVDSVYYEKPYYLEPDKGAAKAYAILRDALKQSEKVGVATFVFRNKEHLALVRPFGDVIVLEVLRFDSEVRKHSELELPPESKTSSKEVDMAVKLIDQLTESFNIEDYKSNYMEDLKQVIDAKVKGKGPHPKVEHAVPATKVKDIMSSLKESLQQFKPHETKKNVRKQSRPKKAKAK